MGTLYVDTGGSANNSGSSDNNAADLSGSAAAFVSGTTVSLLTDNPDLSGVVTSGATQSSINIAGATNSNQTIFWITAVDNSVGVKTVTLNVAPTGMTSNAWTIGGRHVWTANRIEAALRAGDLVTINNSPASASADWLTMRADGSSTSGYIKMKGATGSRPVITITNTTRCLNQASGVGGNWWFEALELVQQGASGAAVNIPEVAPVTLFNIKVSDAGAYGINFGVSGSNHLQASEITSSGTVGLNVAASATLLVGNYVHDVTGDGIEFAGANCSGVVSQNIVDTCTAHGVYLSGADTSQAQILIVAGNTVYGCGDSGLEVTDADRRVFFVNNIFSENGNAAGEYNVEWAAGAAEYVSFHGWNVFYHSGGGGGANLSNLTVNAQVASSEFTTDPAFTNAASGNFSIGPASPARAVGFPGAFLGGSTGYLDIGAVQRREAGVAPTYSIGM